MIDFQKTREAIVSFRSTNLSEHDLQVSGAMWGVCDDVIASRYIFDEHDTDAFSRSFIAFCQHRGLLVLVDGERA